MSAPTPHALVPISARELRERRVALSAVLASEGLDGWIAYGDDRLFEGAGHIRWLSGLHPHFEPVLAVGDRDGTVTLLTGPETVGLAVRETADAGVADVLAMEELVHPGLRYAGIPTCPGPQTLHRLLGESPRVGLIGGGQIPASVIATVLRPLEALGTGLVAADDAAHALRAVKSADEQRLLDAAFAIAADGMREVAEALTPGRSEREVAALAERRMRADGAEGFGIETMVAAGARNSSTVLARTTQRPIAAGDLVTVTLVPRVAGYHASLGRAFVVGSNREARRWIELGWEVQRTGAAALRAGAPGRDAAARCAEVVAAARCGARIDQVWVHSTGVVEFEPPSFAPDSAAPLGAEAAVNVDVPLFDAPWGGLRIEDGYAVEGGAVRPRLRDAEAIVPIDL